ncbi:hypothetical protein ILP92_12285 [Maribius pontilimi]|uniref:NADH-quinone oxidoreductase subunit E n=1 Tax=Palleronia pontilimi TaxID=1964209 RepID=A0A934IHM0_9RHOB|nr:hypothetical protein [Palleronia pontilimi]MBJ3763525.1 hypothetical protein [Palleronia pontilimi]
MTKQTQGSMVIVGAIAGAIGFVAAVALSVLGGFNLSPAIFLAVLVAAVAAVFLFLGFHKGADTGSPDADSLRPSADGKLGDRTVPAGSAGVEPGSAGVEPGSAGKVKTGTLLEGEQELAARKGSWRYEPAGDKAGEVANVENANATDNSKLPGAETSSDSGSVQAEATGAASTGTAKAMADDVDPRDVGTAPARLDGPRDGTADDLKKIKGVGPKMEEMLHGMGFYHYNQIASWNDQEVAWVDANLEGFKGRVTRDDWVPQAKVLAEGGETEFSKKADHS